MSRESTKIRKENEDRLLKMMFDKGRAVKTEMAKETGISVVTINTLVKHLVESRDIVRGSYQKQTAGRPAMEYHFNYDKTHDLLISVQEKDIQQTEKVLELVVKVVNLCDEEKVSQSVDFSEIQMETILDIIREYTEGIHVIGRIGLSIPGKISRGVVTSSWHQKFDGWKIESEVGKMTEIPFKVQNDAHIITMGACLNLGISLKGTVTGFYYPERSMPGITMFSNHQLIEGRNGLAGEAKYLPMLIDTAPPDNGADLSKNISELTAVYNAVVSPDIFIITTQNTNEKLIRKKIAENDVLSRQPNKAEIYFNHHFQESITKGLLWLVRKGTVYEIDK